jgi:hypothetical protein
MRFAAQTPRYLPTSRAPGFGRGGVEQLCHAELAVAHQAVGEHDPEDHRQHRGEPAEGVDLHTFGLFSYRQRCRPVLSHASTANRAYSANGDAVAIQMAGLRSCIHNS